MAQYQVLLKACTIHVVTSVSLLFNCCLVHNLEYAVSVVVNACESCVYISFSQDVCANCLVEICCLEQCSQIIPSCPILVNEATMCKLSHAQWQSKVCWVSDI